MQISVVIPTYNRWPSVARAIQSAIEQNRPADEILVVDDGSTDNTTSRLQQRFGTAINIHKQPNQGVSAARNAAIDRCSGNWIAMLDSDDEWLPGKLEKQTRAISEEADSVLVHTDEIWNRNGVRINPARKHKKRGGDIYEYCLPLCCISPSSAMIKTDVLIQLGRFDENMPACEDYDLWLRLCAHYPVCYIDEPLLVKYGGHQDQLSRKYWGMDRFRIYSLDKLLASSALNQKQRDKTIETLIQKTRILLKGATKHDNADMINHCSKMLKLYDRTE